MDAADLTFYGAVLALVAALGTLWVGGAFRASRPRAALPLRGFLFGEGRWRVWHGLLWLALLAFAVGLVLAWHSSADRLFPALAVLGVSGSALLLMTLVDALLWASRTFGRAWPMRFVVGPATVVTGWLALLVLLAIYLQFIAFVLVDSIVGPVAAFLAAAAVLALNLFAIRAFRVAAPVDWSRGK